MNFLYGNERKVLKLIYNSYKKNKSITRSELSRKIKLSIDETTQICYSLQHEKYINFVGLNSTPKITPKGIDYFATENGEWFSQNIVAILALAVSILALIRTL